MSSHTRHNGKKFRYVYKFAGTDKIKLKYPSGDLRNLIYEDIDDNFNMP